MSCHSFTQQTDPLPLPCTPVQILIMGTFCLSEVITAAGADLGGGGFRGLQPPQMVRVTV